MPQLEMLSASESISSSSFYIVGCEVVRSAIEAQLMQINGTIHCQFLDAGLHKTPEKLTPELQSALDAIHEPARIFLGYGLCGNGVEGLRSGIHTLLIPRLGDCIPLLFGSYEGYARDLVDRPGTLYLSEGWVDNDFTPSGQYEEWREQIGEKKARKVITRCYKHYKRVLLMGFSPQEMDRCRERAYKGAEFLDLDFEERLCSPAFLQRLLFSARSQTENCPDLLVIPPGKTVTAGMFIRQSTITP